MVAFNKCCCCVPLRIGCLILGYLHLLASLILTVMWIVALVSVSAVLAPGDVQVDESAVAAIVAVYVIMLILYAVLLTFSTLLVVGIHKERRGFVKAYLIYCSIFIILYAIMFIVLCVTLPAYVASIISSLIQLMLGVYFLLVIRSYWVTMGENFNSA